MRSAPSAVFVATILAGCSAPSPGVEFTQALGQAPADSFACLEWRDGAIVRYLAPLADTAIPEAARRTADQFIQPEGRSVFRGREWGPAGNGFRFVKVYGADATRRSVLVTATGEVLERSHEIAPADCPVPARTTAAKAGTIQRITVVQRGDVETLRIEVSRDNARWTVDVDPDGNLIGKQRILDAVLNADAPLQP